MRVELIGKQGESVGYHDVAGETPILILGSRYFARSENDDYYKGVKYLESDCMRIEQRSDNSDPSKWDGVERRKAVAA